MALELGPELVDAVAGGRHQEAVAGVSQFILGPGRVVDPVQNLVPAQLSADDGHGCLLFLLLVVGFLPDRAC